jgi:phosphocarrier protein HPr
MDRMTSTGPVRRTVTIANPNGLHMRPATQFAQRAKNYSARITVIHGERKADGKSSLDLILLIAMPGAELLLEIDGDDAEQASEALCEILSSRGEDT